MAEKEISGEQKVEEVLEIAKHLLEIAGPLPATDSLLAIWSWAMPRAFGDQERYKINLSMKMNKKKGNKLVLVWKSKDVQGPRGEFVFYDRAGVIVARVEPPSAILFLASEGVKAEAA